MEIENQYFVVRGDRCDQSTFTEDMKAQLQKLETDFYTYVVQYLRDNQLADFDLVAASTEAQQNTFNFDLLRPLKDKLLAYFRYENVCESLKMLSTYKDPEFKVLANDIISRNKDFILDFLLTNVYDNPKFFADQFGDEGLAISLYQDAIIKFKLEKPLVTLPKAKRLELLSTAMTLSKRLLDRIPISPLQPNQARASSPELRASARLLVLQPLSRYEAIHALPEGLELLALLRPNTVELLKSENKVVRKEAQTYKYFGIALGLVSATAIYLLYREKKNCAKLLSRQDVQEHYPLRTEIGEEGERYARTDWKI